MALASLLAESGGKLREDQGIVRAATGNNELLNCRFAQNEAVQRVDDRKRGENCGGANEIVGLGAMVAPEGWDLFQVRRPILSPPADLAARCFPYIPPHPTPHPPPEP